MALIVSAFLFGLLAGILSERAKRNWPFLKARLHARYVHNDSSCDNTDFTMSREKTTGKLVFVRCEKCGKLIYQDMDLFNKHATLLEEMADEEEDKKVEEK